MHLAGNLHIAGGFIETLSFFQDIFQECQGCGVLGRAFGDEVKISGRRRRKHVGLDGMDKFFLGLVKILFWTYHAIHIRINGNGREAVLQPMCLRVIRIRQVIEAHTPFVVLHGLGNSGVTEHCGSAKVLLLGTEPGCECLCRPACIGTGIYTNLVAFAVTQQLPPGADFTCHPYFSGFFRGNSTFQQDVSIRILAAEIRYHGIATHDECNCAGICFFLMKFTGEHGIVHHPVQNVSHSFAGTSGRYIYLYSRVFHLKIIRPLHCQRVQGKCP